MAQLKQPESNGFEIGALAPAGTYIATCIDVQDQFGVERPKFENPQEKENLDVTRFLFGFKGQDGQPHLVQSFEFRISGSPKSNLFKFLTSWLGHPPKYGWDYCELKAQGAMITVSHKQSRDGSKTYANLIGIAPVMDQLKAQVIPITAFSTSPGAQGNATATQQTAPPQNTAAPSNSYQQPILPPQGQAPATPQTPPQSQPQAPQQAWNPAVDADAECPF